MNEKYNLNDLATITGLTTRTLRNHLRQGMLRGEKIDGAWTFTPEETDAFLAQPAVRQSLEIRRNATVFDFLADRFKPANRACVILDYAVTDAEAEALSRFYCEAAEAVSDIQLHYSRDRGIARIILSGGEDQVIGILDRYYNH